MAERKTPVEPSAPVEPSRRGRRKLEDVEAAAAKAAARTTSKANDVKVQARTRTAVLSEQEKQQAIIDRKKAADLKKRQERNAQRWADLKRRAAAVARNLMIVIPITAPMSIAWTGQSGFAMNVLGWNFLASLLYAAAYELVTVFCAFMYHEAKSDGDKGWEYRVATWLFAIGAGAQQWWHYSDNWHATARSVTYSTMTAIGVIVWELYARLIHRRALRAVGRLLAPRPPIGLARWLRYPRISWTAWSGSVRHGFTEFNDMWIWAETERERGRTRRDKIRDLKAEIKDLKARLADLQPSTPDPVVVVQTERVLTPDLDPIEADLPAIEAGPQELKVGSSERKVGPNGEVFDGPTASEIQAVKEMIEGGVRLNRENVAKYVRDNAERLDQTGISTWRAARVAEWGKGPNALKVVS